MTSIIRHVRCKIRTRADEVSRRLHRLIAERLPARPDLIEVARDAVERWCDAGTLDRRYGARWLELLAGPVAGVQAVLRTDDEVSRALRQNSPFVGAVTPRERWDIIREVTGSPLLTDVLFEETQVRLSRLLVEPARLV